MMQGWIKSAVWRNPQYDDELFRRFLRHYQWRALLVGKKRATAELYAKRGIGAGIQP